MKVTKKVASILVLGAGLAGTASANHHFNTPDCDKAGEHINSAILNLDSAKSSLEGYSYKDRRSGRMSLRKAVADITKAKASVADCGLLPAYFSVDEFEVQLLNPLSVTIDLETHMNTGNLTNELGLSAARLLTVKSLKQSRGSSDDDAIAEIDVAISILDKVESNISSQM